MFETLLNIVSPDTTPDGFAGGFDMEFLTIILFILVFILGALLIYYYVKFDIMKNKYENLKYQIEQKDEKNNKDNDERE